jgi:hypothetical protein
MEDELFGEPRLSLLNSPRLRLFSLGNYQTAELCAELEGMLQVGKTVQVVPMVVLPGSARFHRNAALGMEGNHSVQCLDAVG